MGSLGSIFSLARVGLVPETGLHVAVTSTILV